MHQCQRLTVYDERCPVEEDAGNLVWGWVELLPREKAVEDEAFVRQCTGLDRHRCLYQPQYQHLES